MNAYRVRGEDGEEYGPCLKHELRDWIAENRLGLDSPVRLDEEDSEWKTLQDFPELVVLIAEDEVNRQRGDTIAGLALASLGRRTVAFIIDLLILNLVTLLVGGIIVVATGLDVEKFVNEIRDFIYGESESPPQAYVVFQIISIAIMVLYFTFFVARDGQTPGMQAFRLRVVNQQGMTVSFGVAFLRALALNISIAIYFIGFVLAFFTAKRQTLHDLLAGTYVIQLARDSGPSGS